ncbi:TPA: porin OmpS1 [Salmonella enterica subsp. enterica serovar Wangata]|uniref:Porin OmpS1 n=4 Tax=Salmonella enterica I TaxID=59201 RepID=A0A5V0B4Q6_SALEN|nr:MULTISPECIES: porin OmpS1 [Salmonella]EAA9453753.1 porin OmpS1 [Salmonella enterica subsp. enterica]EBF8250707.1 porin OmpS1 [Salmonella enterica subsp. enterica serovar Eschberg]EBG0214844.1 porin OmpS1 [Salmonella enterica subsp. enterica serovar Louisiana]EBG2761103.1 porin OmpS1 [Salmonella enterica subsp. enterica serovar Ridge]EBG8068774.1 porin OmpS1 [Salmonella enterica subsp. enterica serovar Elisabethville]EBQ9465774.1 porin OmpS1 [Salmonella enterica subsp. enterica serovar Wang
MNRKVLALLVPALLVAGAANAAEVYNKNGNKLDLYGKVDGLRYFSDDAGSDGDQTYARFGFKGETQINDMLTGYGQWEYNIQADSSEGEGANSWTRLGFAGLKFGEYGSFDYGRNYGVIYDVEAWTDVLPEFGGDSYTQTDVYMLGRTNGVATYRNTDFFGLVDGLNFALQYQGNNENGGAGEGTGNGGSRKLARENGDGFGMSASYDFDFGLSLGAAYSSSDRTDNQVARGYGDGMNERNNYAGGETAEAWTVGAKYDAYNVYLAAMYAETRNMTYYGGGNGEDNGGIANKTQNFEVVAQYQFDFGLRPSIAYLQSKGKDLGGQEVHRGNWRYTNKDLVKYVDVGMTYYFNKNMSTYVDYKINLLDEDDDFYANNGIATDDIVGVGLVYQF